MNSFRWTLCMVVWSVACVGQAVAAEGDSYTQHKDIIYADVHGFGLLMDVFTPTGGGNGIGIVDVACGAFHSDRGKINDHKKAGMFDIMCARGYTVFAIRPGSITKFGAAEMIENLNRGVSWVIDHAEEYQIDPERLALIGASAGGYLACLNAVTAEAGSPAEKFKAVGVFFPPTDLLNYGPVQVKVRTDPFFGRTIRKLVFPEGFGNLSDEALEQKVAEFSPARRVTSNAPPFLFIHGDADPLVPLQQSELMVEALKAADVPVELIIKPGGGHPWPTIAEEVAVMASWLDKTLSVETAASQ